MAVLVTGGAGFIGSHIVDKLIEDGKEVVVFDNLVSGKQENVNEKAGFIKGDLVDAEEIDKVLKDNNIEEVWHLAANPNVNISDAEVHFKQNVLTTYNLLEAMVKYDVKKIRFTSTSSVYGEAKQIPTPEDYIPLMPVSVYGAAKLVAESLIREYSNKFGVTAVIFRFANIIGGRSNHGVVVDFVRKLRQDPNELEILGDGKQCKSYLHVLDCVDATFHASSQQKGAVELYNIGSNDRITVDKIADIVAKEMQLTPKRNYTGGRVGWKGDVPLMLLSIEKLKSIGWTPKMNSADAVQKTVCEILGKV